MSDDDRQTVATRVPAVVDLWLLRLSQTPTLAQAKPWAKYLDANERKRCRELRTDVARARFELGHGLVRMALSDSTPVAAADWRFVWSDKGRPEIRAPADFPPVAFSLSYTDGLIVCSVARAGLIGVDVEYVSSDFPYADIESRVLAPCERHAMRMLPAGERRNRFFSLWTLKEAYLKALGVGFEREPATLEFSLAPTGHIDANLGNDIPWQFELLEPEPDYRVAIACGRVESFGVHARRVSMPEGEVQPVTCRSIART